MISFREVVFNVFTTIPLVALLIFVRELRNRTLGSEQLFKYVFDVFWDLLTFAAIFVVLLHFKTLRRLYLIRDTRPFRQKIRDVFLHPLTLLGCGVSLMLFILANLLFIHDFGYVRVGLHVYTLLVLILMTALLLVSSWLLSSSHVFHLLVGVSMILLLFSGTSFLWDKAGYCTSGDWYFSHTWYPQPDHCQPRRVTLSQASV